MRSRAIVYRILGLLILISLLYPPADAFARPGGTPPRSATIEITQLELDVVHEEQRSMGIHMRLQAQGYRDETLRVAVFFNRGDGEYLLVGEGVPGMFRTPSGRLTVQTTVTPHHDNSVWEDLVLYVPNAYFPLPENDREAYVNAAVMFDGGLIAAVDEKPRFDIPEPAATSRSVTIEITQLEFGVMHEGRKSMGIHLRFQAQGYRDETLRVGVFFYWDDDEKIIVQADVPGSFQTAEGHLTVQEDVTPGNDNATWEDFVLYIPYAYFPSPEVDREGYVSASIFLDGENIARVDEKPRFSIAGTNGQHAASTPSTHQGGGASGDTTGSAVDCEVAYDGLFSELTTNQYAVGGYLDDNLDYHDPVISDAGCAILLERVEEIDAMGCNLALVTSSYQQQSDASDAAYDSCKRRHPDDWDRACRTQYFSYQIATTQLVEFQELGIWTTECRWRN